MNRSTPGLPVHHQLPEFTQIHVHRVRDEQKVNGSCQRLRGEGNGELVFNGYRVSIGEDVKVLEMDVGDSCTAK